MREKLRARVATPDEAALLQLAPGEWVVELRRTTFTVDGTVVKFAIGIHAATRFSRAYEFRVPDSAQEETRCFPSRNGRMPKSSGTSRR